MQAATPSCERPDLNASARPTFNTAIGRDYAISAAICLGTSVIAIALSASLGGKPLSAPPFPGNAYLLGLYALWIVTTSVFGRRLRPVQLLGGISFAQCAIAHFFLWVLVAGLIPAKPETELHPVALSLGLAQPTASIPFNAALLLFLTNLGLGSTTRLLKRKRGKLRFALNHLGIWLLLSAGLMSSSDLERWEISVTEGNATALATRAAGHESRYLPFGVALNDFGIEFFAPQLTLVDVGESVIIWEKGEPLIDLEEEAIGQIRAWRIEVLESIASALPDGDGYQASGSPYAAPAARILATNTKNGETVEGWITCGSIASPTRTLLAGDSFRFAMAMPRPKRFYSKVTLFEPDTEPREALLEVNKPIHIAGWSLNQLSYDESAGKASRLSVIEAVRDPWMPIIYFACGMILLGATLTLFSRARANRSPSIDTEKEIER
ncbi:cytochrome c biogenesis protein ResB [Pelagicoccus sp. SDUM812003]|uniref:cytochrome c biogenesis protein ResB n=1 Tax=Pelagicoccus sp. SDUM812003 TaxID=3041267 RepID=UPI00280F8235|nr:cytochrome c biogenesis protein ResB [Pelagicoccus sp. SDUM812003]MDQ8202923.1 cytochrome c biogenesis protein ResB [Pelagicoccus sp. SDUM812003]